MKRWSARRIGLVAVGWVLVLCAGAYGVFAIVSGGGEPPVSIEDVPSPSADSSPTVTTGTSTPASSAFDGDFDGTWTLVEGDSFVGYRVREQLAFLPAPNDAVGRSSAVDGSLEIEGLEIVSTSVTADLTQLESDESRRDFAIRTNGLESDTYPTATFELTEPIAFDRQPAEGEVVDVEATGELTLHGVTQEVTFPLEARWDAGQIVVVGSLEVAFDDYEITAPSIGPATVGDNGTIELQLVFVPSA
jgi:polyisoprenoid-binding protein YceI